MFSRNIGRLLSPLFLSAPYGHYHAAPVIHPVLTKVTANDASTLLLPSVHARSMHTSRSKMMLMDVPEIEPPFPWSFKFVQQVESAIHLWNLSKLDPKFNKNSFTNDAVAAIALVSRHIANGQFDDLTGLVAREAVQIIKQNYSMLTPEQKRSIELIIPDKTFKVWLKAKLAKENGEITATIQVSVSNAFHKVNSELVRKREKGQRAKLRVVSNDDLIKKVNTAVVASYWFVRKVKSGVDDDWLITQLNHTTVEDLIPKKK